MTTEDVTAFTGATAIWAPNGMICWCQFCCYSRPGMDFRLHHLIDDLLDAL